jgi:hypothetical protein
VTTTDPPFDYLRENIFEAFWDVVLDGVHAIAELKHIDITDADAKALSDLITDDIELIDHLRFMRDDPVARMAVETKVRDALDVHMSHAFANLYIEAFGAPLRPYAIGHIRRAVLTHLPQGDFLARATWPPLCVASLTPHLETRCDDLFSSWQDRSATLTFNRGFLLDRPSSEGPALQAFDPDGREALEYWCDGVLHRDPSEGPALILRQSDSGRPIVEEYYVNGALHRDCAPAVLTYDETTGHLVVACYYRHGLQHREDGPASTIYGADGRIASEFWFRDGTLHRDGAPAVIEHGEGVACEQHWIKGHLTATTTVTFEVADAR